MSIIQTIQEKYAKVMAVIIALALLIFVIMLAFENGGSLFSSSNTVGEVDGKEISGESFSHKVQAYQRNSNQQAGEYASAQAVEQAWNETVDSIILAKEYQKLGLTVTDKEINNLIFSENAPQEFKQIFTNPQTGVYDPAFAREQFNKYKKSGNPDEKAYLNLLIDFVERRTLEEKYTSLMANSINVPKWFVEKRNIDNSQMAKLSFVSVPYATISDSAVKVSDDEIRAYLNEHKKQYEQKEESRAISYVSFSAAPSTADSATARNTLLKLKPQFDTINNYKNFVARNSNMPLYEGYISSSAMQQPNKDSILSQPVGVVYGPYLDVNQYVLSKVYSTARVHDTVSIRHILVATHQQMQQGGEPVRVREDSTAKKIIDSVQNLHRSGTSFDSLVVRYSEDPGSKEKGGKYEDITSGRMMPEFNDFIFTNSVGKTGVVQTSYGYHFIEVLSAKGSSAGYKVAYLARPIETSPETESAAQNAAALFAGDSRNEKTFNDNWEKNLKAKGINKLSATDIMPMSYNVQGLNGEARKLVKGIFEADKGDVVGPEKIGDAFVVAVVTSVNKKGEMGTARARTEIEPILRNKKKAEQIKKNIGQISSLEAVAQKTGQQVITADSVRFGSGSPVLGYEPKIIGAAFNPAIKGKVANEAIAGQTGVYVLRVDNISTTPVATANVEEQRRQMEMQARQGLMSQMQYGGGNPFTNSLKKAAKIEDNRAKYW
jgi:peptidyl-prolyl cis-trans isomerase D